MKVFLVGGAVRDELLGRPVTERDYVVVGATPEALTTMGYRPVGRDFPVFLHPDTGEQYALARTERKTAPGYYGFETRFSPDVTLGDDLARRDLTINAMARGADGALIDPHGGRRDLEARWLRHVSPAFVEDPLRMLRVARFAARFSPLGFRVAPETLDLMRRIVEAGEMAALVAERVWAETARALGEARPREYFEVLRACGALAVLLPEVDRLWGVPQPEAHHPEVDCGVHLMMVIDTSAKLQASLPVRFACLMHDLGKGTTEPELLPRHIGHEKRSAELLRAVCERWRVPVEIRELAEVVAREHGNIHRSGALDATPLVRLLERCDAFRKPARFADVLLACECDARGRLGFEDRPYPQRERLLAVLATAAGVPTDAVARAAQQSGAAGPQIGEAIHRARVEAVAASLG